MTLGERLYAAAVATGAHPFAFPYAEAAKMWTDLDEAQQARWEACAVMMYDKVPTILDVGDGEPATASNAGSWRQVPWRSR